MITRKVGVEVELLAPPGKSRRDLAEAIAGRFGGTVKRTFYPQSEPSKVPGRPFFHNLVLGFEVRDARGNWIATCVDDLTLQADLQKTTPPVDGWYRVLSDDLRLLNLIARQADASEPLEAVLKPIAALFGTSPQPGPEGMFRVVDTDGKSVALVAPLPGERERPCELITAPIAENHQEHLETLLALSRELGFTVPAEGATHLHFDGTDLRTARALTNVVRLFHHFGPVLKEFAGTNSRCCRLGSWPDELFQAVDDSDFSGLTWDRVKDRLQKVPLTKYCDFNIVNLLLERPQKTTFEIRVLPVHMQAGPILEVAAVCQRMLDLACSATSLELPAQTDIDSLRALLKTSAV